MGNYDVNWDSDAYRLDYNPGPLYMTSVSPWFFTVGGYRSFEGVSLTSSNSTMVRTRGIRIGSTVVTTGYTIPDGKCSSASARRWTSLKLSPGTVRLTFSYFHRVHLMRYLQIMGNLRILGPSRVINLTRKPGPTTFLTTVGSK